MDFERIEMLEDVLNELNTIMKSEYKTFCSTVVKSLSHKSLPCLKSYLESLKRINAAKDETKVALIRNRIVKTFSSALLINRCDTYSIGVETSIYFQSTKTQSVLNVKHLQTTNSSTANGITNERYILHLSGTVLCNNTKGVVITRTVIRNEYINTVLESLKGIYNNCHIFKNNKCEKQMIVEFYTKTFNIELLLALSRDPNVMRIVFVSDCRSFKRKVFQKSLVFSNIFNLYYCIMMNKAVPSIDSLKDMRCAVAVFVLTNMFMIKDNLSLADQSHGPLSCLTGRNPKFYIRKLFKDNVDFAMTCNRESKIMKGEYFVGSKNANECVFKMK